METTKTLDALVSDLLVKSEVTSKVSFKNVTTLVSPITQAVVHIVGTAHVSVESSEEVRAVIRETLPDFVVLELCDARVAMLTMSDKVADTPPISLSDTLKKAKEVGMFAALISYFYQSVSGKLKIVPGIDLRAGFDEAKKVEGCQVVLGDRPIMATISRTWGSLTTFEKMKFGVMLLFQSVFLDITAKDIEAMKDEDFITSTMKELSVQFPGMAKPLVYERDEFLAHTLTHIPGPKIVAVVGLGHVEGIKRNWERTIDRDSLMKIPPANPNTKYEVLFIVFMFLQNFYILYKMFRWFVI